MHRTLFFLLASATLPALFASSQDQNLVSKTRDRVRANRLTPAERKFDRIGWAPTITEALRLARENNRPVFLLTYYGNVATGRSCGDSFNLRATSLNDDSIISTLNQYFVPVYRSWDDLGASGDATPEERAEHHRIVQEATALKIKMSDVRIFLLNPEGHPLPASLGMSDPFRMQRGLLQTIMELGTKAGEPLIKPKPQSVPPSMPPGSLVLHTVARGTAKGNWREYPAENWTVLPKDQLADLLPPEPQIRPGQVWSVRDQTARAILTTLYPATEEDSRKDRNIIQKSSMKARIVSIDDGIVVARVDAAWTGKRSFYPGREPDHHLDVKAEGFIRFPVDRSDVFSFALATTSAWFEDEEFVGTVEDIKEIPSNP